MSASDSKENIFAFSYITQQNMRNEKNIPYLTPCDHRYLWPIHSGQGHTSKKYCKMIPHCLLTYDVGRIKVVIIYFELSQSSKRVLRESFGLIFS